MGSLGKTKTRTKQQTKHRHRLVQRTSVQCRRHCTTERSHLCLLQYPAIHLLHRDRSGCILTITIIAIPGVCLQPHPPKQRRILSLTTSSGSNRTALQHQVPRPQGYRRRWYLEYLLKLEILPNLRYLGCRWANLSQTVIAPHLI